MQAPNPNQRQLDAIQLLQRAHRAKRLDLLQKCYRLCIQEDAVSTNWTTDDGYRLIEYYSLAFDELGGHHEGAPLISGAPVPPDADQLTVLNALVEAHKQKNLPLVRKSISALTTFDALDVAWEHETLHQNPRQFMVTAWRETYAVWTKEGGNPNEGIAWR